MACSSCRSAVDSTGSNPERWFRVSWGVVCRHSGCNAAVQAVLVVDQVGAVVIGQFELSPVMVRAWWGTPRCTGRATDAAQGS